MSWTMEQTVVSECCITCGITYYVPKTWQAKRREDHKDFYCPNGHAQHYSGKSEAEKLRDQLAREKHRAEQARAWACDERAQRERAERQRAAARGQVTKIKNRVGRGVCPCCGRTFENLRRHMEGQHPDWIPEPVAGSEED